MPDAAPFYEELAEGPSGGHADWLTAEDGLRFRGVFWPKGIAGTVFIYPGRTEFGEKYGRVARDLSARGFATVAVDWRGQGLSDRISDDVNMGHVGLFADYQHDSDALLSAARAAGLAEPYFLIGHSMGGAIGLRALTRDHPFSAAVFSAPMWGIQMSSAARPVAWAVPRVARALGRGARYSPGTQRDSYVVSAEFEGNSLTTDPDQFAYMQRQVRHDPQLALGGPSLDWLHGALAETRFLRSVELPPVPTLAAVGSDEAIVDFADIAAIAGRWPSCRMEVYPGARHELLMERPDVRDALIAAICDHFDAHRGGGAQPAS